MMPIMSLSRLTLLLTGLVLATCMTGCASPFAKVMDDGCEGFRDVLDALERGDSEQYDEAIGNGGFSEPASEEAGGVPENLEQIEVLSAGYSAVAQHIGGNIETGEPPGPLTKSDEAKIRAAREMCEENY